jgi:hypothetical protein
MPSNIGGRLRAAFLVGRTLAWFLLHANLMPVHVGVKSTWNSLCYWQRSYQSPRLYSKVVSWHTCCYVQRSYHAMSHLDVYVRWYGFCYMQLAHHRPQNPSIRKQKKPSPSGKPPRSGRNERTRTNEGEAVE